MIHEYIHIYISMLEESNKILTHSFLPIHYTESGRATNQSSEEEIISPHKEYVSDSNEAIHLKLVKSESDITDEDTTFYPTHTYQLFGEDEKIMGYKNPKIELYYVASTLYTYLRMSYDSKMGSPVDPIHILTKTKKEWGNVESYPIAHEYTPHLEEFTRHINDDFTPPGEQLTGYTKGDSTFEIYRGNISNPKVCKYHRRLQTFCLFFIDGSSYIDEEDPKWEIFMLFEKYKTETNHTRYAIIGYVTVYPFYAYPDSTRLRVSQFVILPPYQKHGHGSKLLSAVYTYSQSGNIKEVCVEDPSDAFQSMRDLVDYKNFCAAFSFDKLPKQWSEEFAQTVQKKLRINKEQIRKCYETAMLEKLKFSNASKERFTEYRLEVKRRLFKTFDMEKSIADADDRKEKLQELYLDVEEQYMHVIAKVRHGEI